MVNLDMVVRFTSQETHLKSKTVILQITQVPQILVEHFIYMTITVNLSVAVLLQIQLLLGVKMVVLYTFMKELV